MTHEKLLCEIIRAQAINEVTPELGEMFLELIDNYALNLPWSAEQEFLLDEMKAEAVCILIKHGLKFNPEKSDDLISFYNTSIHGAFLGVREKERKENAKFYGTLG